MVIAIKITPTAAAAPAMMPTLLLLSPTNFHIHIHNHYIYLYEHTYYACQLCMVHLIHINTIMVIYAYLIDYGMYICLIIYIVLSTS